MYRFFIRRPIVAMVIAIIMVIVGLVAVAGLPVAQYPNIIPSEILVEAYYVGADALTIEQSVATPLEQRMSGVDNMNYMYSLNANSGSMRMTVNFDVKTDPNTNQILSQLRESQAESQFPADVRAFGVTVQKSLTTPLMVLALYSPEGTQDRAFLSNYAYINIVDPLTRVRGIASVTVFGAGQVRPALLGTSGSVGQAQYYRPRDRRRHTETEYGKPFGTGCGRAESSRTGVHLYDPGPGTTCHAGRVRTHRSAGQS